MNTLRNLTNTVLGTTKTVYLAGLGVAATVNDQAQATFNHLVEKGQARSHREETVREPGFTEKLTERVKDLADKTNNRLQDGFSHTLSRFGIPSRDEIQALTRSVEQLTEKVQNLQPSHVG